MKNSSTLSKKEYIEKMRGCWLGKSIGGTLGTPFEPTRGAFDIDYYTAEISVKGYSSRIYVPVTLVGVR